MKVRKLLFPTDFSDGASLALRAAVELAADNDAELILVHVWHPPYVGPEVMFPDVLAADLRRESERELDRVKTEVVRHGFERVRTVFLVGTPWNEIVHYAERHAVDLIVMGTHGRSGIKRVLLGSVAERVVRHASCPVLVVREPAEPARAPGVAHA
jgi:nucleotide-binding universal stress UspA family protein